MGKTFKILIILIFFALLSSSLKADNVSYFIDFSKVLNQSKAGKDAQDLFKKKYNTDAEKFRKKEINFQSKFQVNFARSGMLFDHFETFL